MSSKREHGTLTCRAPPQGFGGPCCARILTSWFATKERGTYWGMWNIAHNLGGFGAPLLAGTAARYYGWKWGARTISLIVSCSLCCGSPTRLTCCGMSGWGMFKIS